MRLRWNGTPNLVNAPDFSRKDINAGNAFFGSPRVSIFQFGSCRSGMRCISDIREECGDGC